MKFLRLLALSFLAIAATTGMAQAVQNNVNAPPPCQAELESVVAAQKAVDDATIVWILAGNEVNNLSADLINLQGAINTENGRFEALKQRIARGEQGKDLVNQYFSLKERIEQLQKDIDTTKWRLGLAQTNLNNASAALQQANGALLNAQSLLTKCRTLLSPNGNQI